MCNMMFFHRKVGGKKMLKEHVCIRVVVLGQQALYRACVKFSDIQQILTDGFGDRSNDWRFPNVQSDCST